VREKSEWGECGVDPALQFLWTITIKERKIDVEKKQRRSSKKKKCTHPIFYWGKEKEAPFHEKSKEKKMARGIRKNTITTKKAHTQIHQIKDKPLH